MRERPAEVVDADVLAEVRRAWDSDVRGVDEEESQITRTDGFRIVH